MLRITSDQPGRVLELVWEGPPPRLWERAALVILWPAALALSGAVVAALWRTPAQSFTPGSDDAWALAIGGLVLALCGGALYMASQGMSYWLQLRLDAETGTASGERVDWLWLRRRVSMSLAQARGAALAFRSGRAAEPSELSLLWPDGARWVVPIPTGADRRRALGLLFSAARILGWRAFTTTRSDALGLEASLLPGLGPGAEPVPAQPEPRPALPPLQAPPFQPLSCRWRTRVEHWEPGALVELSTAYDTGPFWLMNVLGACFTFFATFAALALGCALVALGAAAATLFLGWVLATQSPDGGPIRARLDWKAGTARFRSPRFDRTVPLASVDSLLLDGRVERVPNHGGEGSHTEYRVRLEAHVDGRYELLADARVDPSPDDALLSAMSAALPLADALGAAVDFYDFPRLHL